MTSARCRWCKDQCRWCAEHPAICGDCRECKAASEKDKAASEKDALENSPKFQFRIHDAMIELAQGSGEDQVQDLWKIAYDAGYEAGFAEGRY